MANEKRLIDANRTRYELNVLYCDSRGEIREGVDDAIHIVNLMPTVDAVEVVRCKDCKYRHATYSGKNYFCNLWDSRDSVKDSDFCSYGDRKDNGDLH